MDSVPALDFNRSDVECRAQPSDGRAISCIYRNVCLHGVWIEFFSPTLSSAKEVDFFFMNEDD